MIFTIKSFLFFSVSFLILSFQYNGKSFFEIIQGITGPVGANIQKNISSNFDSSVSKSKKLLTGEPPKPIQDKVNSAKSATKKQLDHLNDGDKKTLENFIKKTTP